MVCYQNKNNNIFYPEDGQGIKDPACSAAFQHVYKKTGNSEAARTQYIQNNEYAVLIPEYAKGFSALTAAVPNNLCSAHAVNVAAQFGDKSGMSVPTIWRPNMIKVDSTSVKSQTIDFTWCATAAHDPSYWEFYVSEPSYDYTKSMLTWDDLTLIHEAPSIPLINGNLEGCTVDKYYKLQLSLPARFNAATLLVRWQRVDPVGECFINCVDYKFTTEGESSTGTNSDAERSGDSTNNNNSAVSIQTMTISTIVLALFSVIMIVA
eukprot:gene6610-7679_t